MKASLILGLVRAQLEGDQEAFKKITLQIAAKEASAGHTRIATELRELSDRLDQVVKVGQSAGRPNKAVPITRPNGDLASLLNASYPKERLDDMVLDEAISKVLRRILNEQRHSNEFSSYGLTPRRKFLLVGPPGSGKTMTAKMIASELSRPLFVVRLEGLLSRYLGETSAHLSSIFDAMQNVTGVYLFDEFDSIGTFRGDSRDIGEVRRVLSTFLQLIENDSSDSIIIAATNYEHVLDDALFRRFDDVIEFSLPSVDLIQKYLEKSLKQVAKKNSLPFNELASKAEGLSFAEVSKAANDAIKAMLMEGKKSLTTDLLEDSIQERCLIRKRIATRS